MTVRAPVRRCRWCATRLRPIQSLTTKQQSDVWGCEHCDLICATPGCLRCGHMKTAA